MGTPRICPAFTFTTDRSVAAFNMPYKEYIETHPNEKFKEPLVATGAIVFDQSLPKRVLLVQRSESDSMPNLWESPGGGCDEEDPSILFSAARELWEEAGLIATHIRRHVGNGYHFVTRRGKTVCKFNFEIEVKTPESGKPSVKLAPIEHQNFIWATEEEVKEGKIGQLELKFTHATQKAVILEAFKVNSLSSKQIVLSF